MSSFQRLASTLLAAAVVGCASRPATPAPVDAPRVPAAPATGVELLQRMHDRYAGRWFTTLAFLENNTLITITGAEQKTQWLEHIAVPGRLRIDYLPLAAHSGVLYERGRVHVFDNGRVARTEPGVNALAVLAFDVYAQPPDTTTRMLDSLGFDLRRMHAATWEGARTWVVGAPAGDTTSSQFWVDADSLLVRRVIVRSPTGATTETRFQRYTDAGGYPIAMELVFLRGGRVYFRQAYADVRVNEVLPAALFDPARWVEAQPGVR
jgi:hypothetical protein